MTNLGLELDELDEKKVEKLREEIGDEPVQNMLEDNLTKVVRQAYDNREQIKKQIEQQKEAAQQPT